MHKLVGWDYDPKDHSRANQLDRYFIKVILVPYLTNVYNSLLNRFNPNKSYIWLESLKRYLNLPELLGIRLVKQINDNNDERIDHNEFVEFFIRLLMGSKR